MHNSATRAHVIAAFVLLSAASLLAACGGTGGAAPDPTAPASDFQLVVLDETYIADGAAAEFKLASSDEGDQVVIDISVAGADNLKALICGLSYDPEQYDPVAVDCTGLLDADGGEVVHKTIALDVAPGEVYHGQILPHPAERNGLSGDAVLARAVFLRQPDHAARTVCTPPINRRSQTSLNWEDGAAQLDWYYFNSGDNNQDGQVNVADLTGFGIHWRETSGNGPWPVDTALSAIDYDNNGEINNADMAALVRYFDVANFSYNVYTSQDADDYPATNDGPNGPGAVLLDVVGLGGAVGDKGVDRLRFYFTVSEPQADAYYWVRPVDSAGLEGTPSTLAGGPE